MKKMKLQVETLVVESFRTGAEARSPGTVRGHGDDCTWFASCLCQTNYYRCGTGMETIYSCAYTQDERCTGPTSEEQCYVSYVVRCLLTEICEPTVEEC